MYVDMHIHTNASDGSYSIPEVVEEIKKKDISYFSICDHDTIENSKKMQEYLDSIGEKNINFIPGIEISTLYKGRETHILFYSYDITDPDVVEFGLKAQRARDEKVEIFIKELEVEYPGLISFEEYKDYTFDSKKGGFKLINYLMEKELVDFKSFFEPKWRNRWARYEFLPSEDVIKRLKDKNGKVVLAHPSYYYKDGVMPLDELNDFKEFGIDGIECLSPYCNEKNYDYYINYCHENNLLVTVGSDSHGTFTKEREVGKPKVNLENEDLKETLNKVYKL